MGRHRKECTLLAAVGFGVAILAAAESGAQLVDPPLG